MTAARQLGLDLPVTPRLGAEDFLVSASNEAAFRMVERWPDWPDRVLLLLGPAGSGKSHLAAIWAARAGARRLDVLPEAPPPGVAFLVEDADRSGAPEARLFHLLNAARLSGAFLLLTARTPPDVWGLATPDLLSRLRQAPVTAIAPPDDALLRAVLVKHFADRQVAIDADVVEFLARRIERSFAGAEQAVATLDREALARGRRITRALAADLLRGATPDLFGGSER